MSSKREDLFEDRNEVLRLAEWFDGKGCALRKDEATVIVEMMEGNLPFLPTKPATPELDRRPLPYGVAGVGKMRASAARGFAPPMA
jgi:hypothetical protein